VGTLQVVVGGQQGSEGKGAITAFLAKRSAHAGRVTVAIRVAGPNAGHTAYSPDGTAWALRQIPVAGVVDPNVQLAIGPGSEIDWPVLLDEITRLEEHGIPIRNRLIVDSSATMLTDEHKAAEANAGLVGKIGSTGKGIGAARADRIMRKAELAGGETWLPVLTEAGVMVQHQTHLLVKAVLESPGSTVLIEGTQGFGLGLHGTAYPKCTSSDCRAVDFVAMAGLDQNWADDYEVYVVARTYPIRVAGDSGPLKGETTWEDLGLEPEKTTVTHKIRRVGEWDPELVANAVIANGGPKVVKIALTMADYIVPAAYGATSVVFEDSGTAKDMQDLVNRVITDAGAPVTLVGTSPTTVIDMEDWNV
jgi:adenylosuccinate synthase